MRAYLPRRVIGIGGLAVLMAICAGTSIAADVPQTPAYSTAPLREPPPNPAALAAAADKASAALETQAAMFDEARKVRAREHLYFLIDARIRQNLAATKKVFPAEHDHVLATLFLWVERLGVYGGNQVYNALKDPKAPALDPILLPPAGLTLKYEKEMLVVDSDAGWHVAVPYYFMIGKLDDFTASNGAQYQILVVSTGTAKDVSKVGRSQATLMLVFGPDKDLKPFQDFWEKALELPADADVQKLGVRGLTSRHHLDETLKLHKEVAFWKAERGAMGVFYLGNDGTYQWNREHYLDFLRALSTSAAVTR